MQLIIAEKPSVARDLARVLGIRPSGQHSFEGDAGVITWCIGHLVELDEPASYDPAWKSWRLDALPMLPDVFRLRGSRHTAPQLRAVTALLRDPRFTSIVNACDAGREGELIFRYVHQYAGARAPVRRLWISSLTDEAIRRGFAALRPGAHLDPLGDAARARSEADWLVGMNATRAVTTRGRQFGHTALYSIGRVQTPTLAMLVERERAILAFVPRDYWEVRAEMRAATGEKFPALWRHGKLSRLGTAAIADAIVSRDQSQPAVVERIRARTTREPPPLLFDLTSLQRTANRRFGFSAQRTLELAQALYERHKLLTYPRTDSRHLTTDVVPELPALFAALDTGDYAPFASVLRAQPPTPGRRIVDDTKVHDHHAIIPTGTGTRIESLDRDERRLYDLVVRRFLGAFFPDAEIALTEAWIRVGPPGAALDVGPEAPREDPDSPILATLPPPPDRYLARGRVRLVAGWQDVAGIDGAHAPDDKRGDEAPSTTMLPPLVEGQPLDGTYRALAKQTTPPSRHTEASLLGAMESAGKAIDDEALRTAMKDCGLGTPATRASIIETLLRREYIDRAKQHLVPTALGIGLIGSLPVASLASPELTGSWEARLAQIARGEDSRAAFMADIARYVADMVAAVRGSTMPPPPAGQPPPRVWDSDKGAGSPTVATPRKDNAPTGMRAKATRAARANGPTKAAGSTPRAKKSPREPRSVPRASAQSDANSVVRSNAPATGARSVARASAESDANSVVRSDAPATGARSAPRSNATANEARSVARSNASATGARSAVRSPAPVSEARSAVRSPAPASEARSVARSTPPGDARLTTPRPTTSAPRTATRPSATGGSSAGRVTSRPTGSGGSTARGARAPAPIEALTCPRCGTGTLIAGNRAWGCDRFREGCRFVVWFRTAGKWLTYGQLTELVTRGMTHKTKFAPHGPEIDGRLVLEPGAEGGARFEPG
ncbi:MAG: DNA topoisomerase III [Deltaproteobacteria bacterium]|nr:DNA topoisomerase III [Deltaproteobacteria bacterium]